MTQKESPVNCTVVVPLKGYLLSHCTREIEHGKEFKVAHRKKLDLEAECLYVSGNLKRSDEEETQ